jgi:hypothetical protein
MCLAVVWLPGMGAIVTALVKLLSDLCWSRSQTICDASLWVTVMLIYAPHTIYGAYL